MKQQPTVVITGASAGVGRATAHAFAHIGASVGLIARDPQSLDDTAFEVERLGGRALVLPADVSNADAVFAAADRVEHCFGSIDIWINCAMVTVFSRVRDMTPDEVRRITEVTYLGYVNGTMAALRHMLPRDHGTIVQVGSALAYRGIPLQAGYCGAKHAIRGFTDSLRCELIHDRSRVKLTAVHLPAVNTPQFDWARTHARHEPRPVAPVMQPEDIADIVVKAAFRPVREYWVGQSSAMVILGNMVAPGLLDRYLAYTTVEGQETDRPVAPDRRDNLYDPVPGLHRTHGRFDAEAQPLRVATTGGTVRRAIALAGLALAGGMTWAALSARR